MSNQPDEQQDRQYEIDRITFQYATAYRQGQAPRIEDYVGRYPQYADELLAYAFYFHTIGVESEPFEEPAELTLSPAGAKALAQIQEQRTAYAAVTIQSLAQQGNMVGYTPPQLAEAVGLTTALLGRLEARAIAATTIPRTLFQRLAETLQAPAAAITAYLEATPGQAGGFYYADRPPTQQQESFLDAVQASALSPERKQEWAAIVERDSGAGA